MEAKKCLINGQAKNPSLPPFPMVPLRTFHSWAPLRPNPDEPPVFSNTFPEELSDRAPIKNYFRSLSNYTRVCSLRIEVVFIATHGTNTYNTQLWLSTSLAFIYYTRIRTRYDHNEQKINLNCCHGGLYGLKGYF